MRVLRCRCRVLVVAGGVGLCLVIAVAPSALGQPATMHTAGSSVPVTPCPVSPEPGFSAPPAPSPTVVLPPSITVPPGAAVYGADEDYGSPSSRMTFSIGPAGLHCTVAEGADGGFTVALAASRRGVPSVEYTYSTGGVGTGPLEACPYFSALVSVAGGAGCSRPVGAIVTQIPTGQPRLWAATILDPPGVPLLVGVSPSSREALNVMVASADQTQFAMCALPPGQRQVCLAGLDYFVTQTIAAQAGPETLAAVQAGIGNMAPRPRSSGAAPDADCHANVDVSLDDEIGQSKPFAIPADLVDLPEVQGQVSVSLILEDGAVCDSRLTPVLHTPVLYDGNLSLGVTLSGCAKRGPFVYAAKSTRWTSTPGAPAGQHLVTRFNLASVSASVDPKLSLAFHSNGELEPALDLASVSISAFRLEVTLVRQSGALLQVGLGPTLELTAEIDPREAAEEVEDGESEGLPSGAIDVDVADQLGANTAIGIDDAATEFFGLDISAPVSEALAREIAGSLFSDLESDSALAGFTSADSADDLPPDDQPIDSEFTPAEEAAADTETEGLGDIIVDAFGDLLLGLF